jgi:hypothetical protein
MTTAMPARGYGVTGVQDVPTIDRACTVHVLQPRRGSDLVLAPITAASSSGSAATLPVVMLPGDVGDSTGSMLAALRATGVPFAQVVNIQSLAEDDAGLTTIALAETEPVDDGPLPGYGWVPVETVAVAAIPPIAPALHRRALAVAMPVSAESARWFQPGWISDLDAWAKARLANLGRTVTAPPLVVHVGPIAAVLRFETTAGAMYLKASIPFFAREATIMAALCAGTPAWVPDVVAADPAYGTLMEAMDGQLLGDAPEDTWDLGLRRLAELQLAWVGRSDTLLTAGAQDRPIAALERLVGDLEPVHARLMAAEPGAWPEWAAVADGLAASCASLAASNIPDTLVHGDLHPGNIMVLDGEARLFDWSDGAVSHPFVDLTCFLRRAETPPARRRMADAYLALWAAGYGMARVERALDDALVVGALYQVQTYMALVPAMDLRDRWQFEDGPWRWLRFAIRPLEVGPRSRAVD